jgi:protein gp37
MGENTKIEWTDATWNPVTGCSKVSQGCKHCYAERDWPRFHGKQTFVERWDDGVAKTARPRRFTDVMVHPERLDQPIRWTKPRRIFVNSMSDLFHEAVPDKFLDRVFAVMALCPHHTFQVLTKRPERMRAYLSQPHVECRWIAAAGADAAILRLPVKHHQCVSDAGFPTKNIWLGVSVEDQQAADERIPLLLQTPAAVRWISAEPLLGAVNLTRLWSGTDGSGLLKLWTNALRGTTIIDDPVFGAGGVAPAKLDWVVIGGESGPKARPMHPDWARSLRDQCQAAGVKFLFKQHGEWLATAFCDDDMASLPSKRTIYVRRDGSYHDGSHGVDFFGGEEETAWVGKKAAGRLLDGRTWDEYPILAPK